jgi:uridine kinase
MTLIALAGGSGSGKSTLAEALARRLHWPTAPAAVLAEDDYYHCSSLVEGFDPAAYDFDALSAKDMALLARHLAALKAGQSVAKPLYDFASHRRLPQTSPFAPPRYLILEGIHALSDETVCGLADLRVLLDVPGDVRLARRLTRDITERARTPHSVIAQYFATVAPNHASVAGLHEARADLRLEADWRTGITALRDSVLAALAARGLL